MLNQDLNTDVKIQLVDVNDEQRVSLRIEQNDHVMDVVPFYNETDDTKGTIIECSCGFENQLEATSYGEYRDLVADNIHFVDAHDKLVAQCYSNIYAMN